MKKKEKKKIEINKIIIIFGCILYKLHNKNSFNIIIIINIITFIFSHNKYIRNYRKNNNNNNSTYNDNNASVAALFIRVFACLLSLLLSLLL